MAIIDDLPRSTSQRRDIAWLSHALSGLQIITTASSFVFLFALVIGLI